jgi:hypothetical protein
MTLVAEITFAVNIIDPEQMLAIFFCQFFIPLGLAFAIEVFKINYTSIKAYFWKKVKTMRRKIAN